MKILTIIHIYDKFSTGTKRVLNVCEMKSGDGMLNSIVERYSRLDPLSETEVKIVRSAVKLFLSEGYTHTTFRQIAEDSGVKLGVITYHFRTKEDLLLLLAEELMDYHAGVIEEMVNADNDVLFAYAAEIVTQIAICESDLKMWDLYHAIYAHPITYEHIKSWAAIKNYNLFKERLQHWTESDFREKEVVASGIEFAAIKSFCDRNFTLERKIAVVLDSLLMLYETSKEERATVVEKILKSDCKKMSEKLLCDFAKKLDNSQAS